MTWLTEFLDQIISNYDSYCLWKHIVVLITIIIVYLIWRKLWTALHYSIWVIVLNFQSNCFNPLMHNRNNTLEYDASFGANPSLCVNSSDSVHWTSIGPQNSSAAHCSHSSQNNTGARVNVKWIFWNATAIQPRHFTL